MNIRILLLLLATAAAGWGQTTWSLSPPIGSIVAGAYVAPVGLTTSTVVTVTATDVPTGAKQSWAILVGPDYVASGQSKQFTFTAPPPPPPAGVSVYLSDLTWASASNGWGPVEKNMSNGENGAGDGKLMAMGTVTYAKGLGTHAPANIHYSLAGGGCTTFTSDAGIDNEIRPNGSVVFQVFGDGVKLYDSGKMTAASPTQKISVGIAGKADLQLVVTDAGDGIGSDHADWAAAKVQCTSIQPSTPPPPPPPPPVTGTGCAPNCIASGPLVISQSNQTIQGVRITSVSGHCILINPGVQNTIVKGVELGSCSRSGLYSDGAGNVTVTNTYIHDTVGEGVTAQNTDGLTVTDSRMERVSTGVYAVSSKRVVVQYTSFLNVRGPFPRGQFVQYDKVTGPGNRVKCNTGTNVLGQSVPEDAINIYQSSGDPADPIQVTGNKILGGGPSASGGGIMLGDDGGANVTASFNILVDPGQYGISVACGQRMKVTGNSIYARQQPFTNVGVSVWKQYAPPCDLIDVQTNLVNWTNSAGAKNGAWNAGNCTNVTGWSTNNWNAAIDASIINNPINACAR